MNLSPVFNKEQDIIHSGIFSSSHLLSKNYTHMSIHQFLGFELASWWQSNAISYIVLLYLLCCNYN